MAIAAFLIAQLSAIDELFYLGAIIYGIAISGGVIGWNLGHNDSVSAGSNNKTTQKGDAENPMDYMAVHVTLTGLRGLIMPLVGIALYQWLESRSVGLGKFALLLPLSMTSLGAILFVIFNRQNKGA